VEIESEAMREIRKPPSRWGTRKKPYLRAEWRLQANRKKMERKRRIGGSRAKVFVDIGKKV
jgi:hypothetical protein